MKNSSDLSFWVRFWPTEVDETDHVLVTAFAGDTDSVLDVLEARKWRQNQFLDQNMALKGYDLPLKVWSRMLECHQACGGKTILAWPVEIVGRNALSVIAGEEKIAVKDATRYLSESIEDLKESKFD